MSEVQKQIVLAIETTQLKGSVSVWEANFEKGFVIGEEKISKSENFLELIEKVLVQTSVEKEKIGLIAVSGGPGSQTGIRIGLALAKGLSDALRISYRVTMLFEALRFERGLNFTKDLSALFVGRGRICYQIFDEQTATSNVCSEMEFTEVLKIFFNQGGQRAFLTEEVYRNVEPQTILKDQQIIAVKENLAGLVGKSVIIKENF